MPEILFSGISTRSDVQLQMMAKDLKFRIKVVEGLFLCSENKGADQRRCYCAADLRLCFHICKNKFPDKAAHMWQSKTDENRHTQIRSINIRISDFVCNFSSIYP